MDRQPPPVATPSITPGKRKRLPARRIADWLRAEIVGGHLQPGEQLPTRAELERTLGASSVTIQRALDELRESGFVDVYGSRGTFVSRRPPHRYCVGLVFPTIASRKPTLFWQAIHRVVSELEAYPDLDIVSYSDVDRTSRTPGYQKLLDDIRKRRLAGLIMVNSPPGHFADTPIVDAPGLARANIGSSSHGFVGARMAPYADRVLQRAAREGRQRLALIHPAHNNEVARTAQAWRNAAARFNIELRPQWIFPVHPSVAIGAKSIAHALLTASNPADRPDAIMIQDDHLVEAASQGIADAGMAPPGSLSVYAHCNFPVPPPAVVPVVHVGYDMHQVLRLCLDIIEGQLAGKAPDEATVEAVFGEGSGSHGEATMPPHHPARASGQAHSQAT